tara:strand:+ start:499 stop:1032 length:534 start_codon:yes stop_codon:yes gene_type:complete
MKYFIIIKIFADHKKTMPAGSNRAIPVVLNPHVIATTNAIKKFQNKIALLALVFADLRYKIAKHAKSTGIIVLVKRYGMKPRTPNVDLKDPLSTYPKTTLIEPKPKTKTIPKIIFTQRTLCAKVKKSLSVYTFFEILLPVLCLLAAIDVRRIKAIVPKLDAENTKIYCKYAIEAPFG